MSAESRRRKKKAQRKKKKEQERVAKLPNTLEFPFKSVSDIEVAMGGRVDYQLKEAVPDEFRKDNNKWSQFVSRAFFGGATLTKSDKINPKVYTQQLRHFKSILGSFDYSHEDKTAICAWMASLMWKDVPDGR